MARRSAVGAVLAKIGWMVGVLVAAASLIGLWGALGWPFDLATSFRPHYVVVLIPLGIVAAVRRRAASAVLFLMVGALNAALVAPYLVGKGPDADAPGARLVVLSFNVGLSNPNRELVTDYLAEVGPDLVLLIESSFEWEDAVAAEGLPLATVAAVPADRVTGITVLAAPRLRARVVPTGFAPVDQAVAVQIVVDGTESVVLALHPPSPLSPNRHGVRDRLLADAGDWVADRQSPVIVVGDFNATPWSAAFRELRWRGRLRDTMVGAGLQPTFPKDWGPLGIPIDHALHTAGLAAVERRTGPHLGSDHRPLIVTLAVAD